jgi:hypothetical protein
VATAVSTFAASNRRPDSTGEILYGRGLRAMLRPVFSLSKPHGATTLNLGRPVLG